MMIVQFITAFDLLSLTNIDATANINDEPAAQVPTEVHNPCRLPISCQLINHEIKAEGYCKGKRRRVSYSKNKIKIEKGTKAEKKLTSSHKIAKAFGHFEGTISHELLIFIKKQVKLSSTKKKVKRQLNQDPFENCFGSMQQQTGNADNPTPVQFVRAYRKLFRVYLVTVAESGFLDLPLQDGDSVVADKDFATSDYEKRLERKIENFNEPSGPDQAPRSQLNASYKANNGNFLKFLEEISEAKPACLYVHPLFADGYIPGTVEKQFPSPFTELYDPNSGTLLFEDLLQSESESEPLC
eukprot:gene5684-10928_t